MVQRPAALDRGPVRPQRLSNALEWATRSGDAWAERWRDTDRALSGLAPALQAALVAAAPSGAFRALDIGCGAGSTTLALAIARPDATIVACDLSPALVEVARNQLEPLPSVEVVLGDAAQIALERAPFDLLYSRHGVMFFPDPFAAFAKLRRAASAGAKLVFSCFKDWSSNLWASELASVAAGGALPPPGREPSGFAFAEPGYDGRERADAVQRMRGIIEAHFDGKKVEFEAAAWVWTARAAAPARRMSAATA